jgi:lipopolysaccharide biosynthesis glycosyltransferase
MHILFTLNEQYAPHLGALIVSILKSQHDDTELNFHIISFAFSEESKEKIDSLKLIRDFNIKYYDANAYSINWDLFECTMNHITVETYFRLYAHVFLNAVDKVLHLDVDLLVFDDLLPFWHTELGDNYMAGVRGNTINGTHLAAAGFDVKKHTYYLAGSNLLNLKKMRESNISDLIFNLISNYSLLMKFQDQDIMNVLFKDYSQTVPLRFNADTSIFNDAEVKERLRRDKYSEYIEAIKTPTIVHFSRPIKAWHAHSRNPFAKYYKDYLDLTPWKNQCPEPLPIKARLKTIYVNVFRNCLLKKLRPAATPYLDWYMRKQIERYLNKTKRSAFYTEGMVIFTHILPADSLFFYLEKMLGCCFTNNPDEADAMLIWGTKFFNYRHKVFKNGAKKNLPLFLGEDGFIRSKDIAALGFPGLSVILDNMGIYYDADLGGVFDQDLNSNEPISLKEREAAERAMSYIRDHHLSKYNMVAAQELNFDPEKKYDSVVLVIDQRKGDQSVSGAKANQASFERMLNDAIKENPKSYILVKTHPDAISGGFEGYFNSYKPTADNIKLLHENLNPISLLKAADKVYVVSSQFGMEGLICGKEVYCYGTPFYSGWGLTTDRGAKRMVHKARSLEEVFHVAYMKHTFYYRPDSGQKTDIFGLLTYLQAETQKVSQA